MSSTLERWNRSAFKSFRLLRSQWAILKDVLYTHRHGIDIPDINRYVMYANIPDVAQDSGEAQHGDSVVILPCHGIFCWETLWRSRWKKAAGNDAWTAKMLQCYVYVNIDIKTCLRSWLEKPYN